MRIHYGMALVIALSACSSGSQHVTPNAGVQARAGLRPEGGGYRLLYSFRGGPADGKWPAGPLVRVGNEMYGVLKSAGVSHKGVVYAIDPSGNERVVYAFRGGPSDGNQPSSLTSDGGMLYGTTLLGGSAHRGTVFSVTTSGQEQLLHSFGRGHDGTMPLGVVAAGGTLYGTAQTGGAYGGGTVFSVGESGGERTIYSFKGGSDGWTPSSLPLVENGVVYGTTYTGGSSACYNVGCGIVYSVTTSGDERVLYAFSNTPDGAYAGNIVRFHGAIYGVTSFGGAYRAGTVFSLSSSGRERVVHSFTGGDDGYNPTGLIVASRRLFVTSALSYGFVGSLLQVNANGNVKVLHQFVGPRHDGEEPSGGFLAADGTLYGTTIYGGALNRGTVYALTL